MSEPTPMPDWMRKEYEVAEKEIANWSPEKRMAAGVKEVKEELLGDEEAIYLEVMRVNDAIAVSTLSIRNLKLTRDMLRRVCNHRLTVHHPASCAEDDAWDECQICGKEL